MDNTDPPKKKRGRPRKEKAPKEKKPRGRPRKTQSQKQKQSQNVKVIVNAPAAPKRRYRRKPAAAAAPVIQQIPIPPRVIEVPVPVPFEKPVANTPGNPPPPPEPGSAPILRDQTRSETMVPSKAPTVEKASQAGGPLITEIASRSILRPVKKDAETQMEPFSRPKVIAPPPAAAVDQPSPLITESATPKKSSMFDNINVGMSEGMEEPKTPRSAMSFGMTPSRVFDEPRPAKPLLAEPKPNNVMMDNVSAMDSEVGDEMSDIGSSVSNPTRKKTAPEKIGSRGPVAKTIESYRNIKIGVPTEFDKVRDYAEWKDKFMAEFANWSVGKINPKTEEFIKDLRGQQKKATNISMVMPPPEKKPAKKKGVYTLPPKTGAESGIESERASALFS